MTYLVVVDELWMKNKTVISNYIIEKKSNWYHDTARGLLFSYQIEYQHLKYDVIVMSCS